MQGIEFISENENKYFYDNTSGFIFAQNGIPQAFEPEPSMQMQEKPVINYDVLHQHLSKFGFKQLILEVTQECNMRCKYCCYGEHYYSTRNHGYEAMDFEVAKKAIDLYMANFLPTYRINPLRNPTITFYGGEPLINFKLVQAVVAYVKETYPDYYADYNITTNGLLLSEQVIDFFVENNFSVIVSLDGDQENHDRNRVKRNHEGSFNTVFGNVMRFKNKYPDYLRLGFSVCMDYHTNLYKLSEFVKENDLFIVTMNMISDQEGDYYAQFTETDKNRFTDQMNDLRNQYFAAASKESMLLAEHNLLMALFAYEYIEFGCHSVKGEGRSACMPYTGSCIPGEKIYVTVDGALHICEKISNHFPIGNVDKGLDYQQIITYIEDFNRYHEKCRRCNVSRLCSVCFARATNHDQIEIPENYCPERYRSAQNILKSYVDLMEAKPNQLNNIVMSYYADLKNRLGEIVD